MRNDLRALSDVLDIAALRRKLESESGESFWRSLDELAETPEFTRHLHREFQEGASEWNDTAGRRKFMKLMGASLALTGVQGCISGPPKENILPYVESPEVVVPGRPNFYATTFSFRGYGQGVFVESHTGRPTKIEGNPDHPASLGGTNVFSQASVLGLYDPNRSTTPRFRGEMATVDQFTGWLQDVMRRYRSNGGHGLYVLSEDTTSPTLGAQIGAFLQEFPEAGWHLHEPVGAGHVEEGLRRVFGRPMAPVYHIGEADAILSVDSDFLFALPGSLRYAREFSDRRRVREAQTEMNRLYTVESTVTITGAMSDHRLPLRPSGVHRFLRALASHFGVADAEITVSRRDRDWLTRMADDLVESRGVLVAGEPLPPEQHVLAHRINERLGNVGQTVEYIEPVTVQPPRGRHGLRSLVSEIEAGRVETLIILGANPAYTAPAGSNFVAALMDVPSSVHLSMHRDETSRLCTWHVPKTHYLEEWGDLRAFDGTASIVQPLISPLYEACRSAHDVLSTMLGNPGVGGYELVRTYWRDRLPGAFEAMWEDVLRLGVIPGTGLLTEGELAARAVRAAEVLSDADADTLAFGGPPATEPLAARRPPPDTTAAPADAVGMPDTVTRTDTFASPDAVPDRDTVPEAERGLPPGEQDLVDEQTDDPEEELEIVFRPDPSIWDGRYATNHWLQELPKAITKLVWDNAILISPDLSERKGIEREQVVELTFEGQTIAGPVWIVPGHPPDTVTVYLGYGRTSASPEVNGNGYNAYLIRTDADQWTGQGVQLRKVDESRQLVSTQHHHSMEGRAIVEEAAIGRFRDNPDFLHEGEPEELASLYPDYEYPINKWGMVIDLNVCIGCNACITACQSENNIPVVGKQEVRRGREMHWLRVDRYYKGPLYNPEIYFQPVPCMHCEKAPCEVVCPVYATVHDAEGLNVMVYNRCIGTRYCSNNCPYKVRRFNFLDYTKWKDAPPALQTNPDVTVRSRGVMEKCTYCIQRISAARIRAKKENRPIHDGEVKTACQMACPTEAITFGDLAKPESAVHRLHEQPHNYKLLHHLGTRPRTSYLAHFRNPNERMPGPEGVEFRIGQEEKIEVEVGSERE